MTDPKKHIVLVDVPKLYEEAAEKPFPDFRQMFGNLSENECESITWNKSCNLIDMKWSGYNYMRAVLALFWDTKLPKTDGLHTAKSDSWALVSLWLDYRMVEVYVRPTLYDVDGRNITFLWKDTGTFPGDVYRDEAATA